MFPLPTKWLAWSGWRKSSIRLIGQDAARITYRLSCRRRTIAPIAIYKAFYKA
jgi:hypothetical protein